MIRFKAWSVSKLAATALLVFAAQPGFAQSVCPVNMVSVGPICVDKYEASVWSRPPNARGTPQGTQFGLAADDYPCSDNGNNCSRPGSSKRIFAVSAPRVVPSQRMTWFQAQQACVNVGKRLLEKRRVADGRSGHARPGNG